MRLNVEGLGLTGTRAFYTPTTRLHTPTAFTRAHMRSHTNQAFTHTITAFTRAHMRSHTNQAFTHTHGVYPGTYAFTHEPSVYTHTITAFTRAQSGLGLGLTVGAQFFLKKEADVI